MLQYPRVACRMQVGGTHRGGWPSTVVDNETTDGRMGGPTELSRAADALCSFAAASLRLG